MKIAKCHLLTKLVPFTPKVSKIIDDGIERLFGDSQIDLCRGAHGVISKETEKLGEKSLCV